MNYLKHLEEKGLSQQDLDTLTQAFVERGKADPQNQLPEAVYNSAAVDILLGAIDLSADTLESMKEGHDVRHWVTVLTGITL